MLVARRLEVMLFDVSGELEAQFWDEDGWSVMMSQVGLLELDEVRLVVKKGFAKVRRLHCTDDFL